MREGRTIVLVGGGRWGRVHASNLMELLTSRDRVLWVSRHNESILTKIIAQRAEGGPAFASAANLDDALVEQPSAALIVTAPETHFSMAAACLRRGIHTFVEKPLAFCADEARLLVGMAVEADAVLAVGFHLLSASYLHHFKAHFSDRSIARISIRWFDPAHEVRYGEIKRSNEFSPLVHDIYPHTWSIVRALTGNARQEIIAASSKSDELLTFESRADVTKIDVQCGRNAHMRERKINLVFQDGGTACLDFTQEPGAATLDEMVVSPDPLWGVSPRPVMAEIETFLKQISPGARDRTWSHLAANCIDSVIGAQKLCSELEYSLGLRRP